MSEKEGTMPFSKDAIRNLLAFLESKYPGFYEDIESLKNQAPPQINPDELFRNLMFCREEGFIDCVPISEDARGIVDLKYIKINSKGIRFLRGF
jgi:hypothetical protein